MRLYPMHARRVVAAGVVLASLEGRTPLLSTDPRLPSNQRHDVEHERPAPLHSTLDLVRLERVLCAQAGHREVDERRGEPVLAFKLCVRCGKVGERLG